MKSSVIDLRQNSKYVSLSGNYMFKFNSETEYYLLKVSIIVNITFIADFEQAFPFVVNGLNVLTVTPELGHSPLAV